MIELADVEAAARTLDGVAHRTPVLTSRTLDERAQASVFVKCENLQRSGAFKFRGAYNKLASLTADQRVAGVVAYSSGNHAGAVALAARELGIPATIVMPHDAPAVKRAATEGYGAQVVGYDKRTERREPIATRLAEERGLTLIKPFDDPLIMAGQGTVGLELLDQAPPLDAVLVPVGGGGLIAGVSTAVKGLSPTTTVIGVEPEAGDDHQRSMAAGERISIGLPDTIADGLQAGQPGELTWEVNSKRVDHFVTVTDDELVDTMVFAFDRMKIVIEPSGAAALAAALAGAATGRVGVVISGGNVGARWFADLLSRHG